MSRHGLRVGPTVTGLFLILFVGRPGVEAQKKDNARVMGLVELYGISASIIYGEEDEFAANLLLEFLKPHLAGIKTFPAKGSKARRDDLVIYVGSFDKNIPSAKAFKSLGYSLNWDALTEGSFLLKTFRKEGKTTIFVTGKDWLGTLYAAHDLKNYYLRIEMGRVLLNELNLAERAQLKYRWFRLSSNPVNWQTLEAGASLNAEARFPQTRYWLRATQGDCGLHECTQAERLGSLGFSK